MSEIPNPITLITLLFVFGLIPFLVVMTTSFVKLVVVFFLIRNALGIQQIPPNIVLHGLALILTVYIMAPVVTDVVQLAEQVDLEKATAEQLIELGAQSLTPYQEFLAKHAGQTETQFFIDTALRIWPSEERDNATADNLLILIPAFTLTELKEAFEIGFLIYLPFVAIDLIVSNILLAMGMMMVSPMTISLPFKLLLFVLLDGWTQLISGLVLSYQ